MDWLDVAQRFGFPVAMCVIFIYAFWRVSIWLAANVVDPIVRTHLEFMRKLQACMDQNTDLLRSQTQNNLSIAQQLQAQGELLDAISEKLEKIPSCQYPPGQQPKSGPGWMK